MLQCVLISIFPHKNYICCRIKILILGTIYVEKHICLKSYFNDWKFNNDAYE